MSSTPTPASSSRRTASTIAPERVRTVSEHGGAVMEAARRLSLAGVGVEDLVARRATLDDVFLSLTGHVSEERVELEVAA